MTQQIEDSIWQEFEKEATKIITTNIRVVFPISANHKEFWEKFLTEEFPNGALNQVLEKNLAIWIVEKSLDLEQVIKNSFKEVD